MPMPLEGIRILDMTIWQQGPHSTAMLADMGAEVIKIEQPVVGDPGRGLVVVDPSTGLSPYFESHNRGKKSITIDMKKDEGRKLVYRLVENSDVFVQNFRLGVADRLGVGYGVLSKINPKLIYASASGYGPKGPDRERPSFDVIGVARSGAMSVTGEPDGPPGRIGMALGDQVGGMVLAYGIVLALLARERYGVGQELDVSLLGSLVALQDSGFLRYLLTGLPSQRVARKNTQNPLWNVYRAQDGRWVSLGMLQSDRYWHKFCKVMGIEHVEHDPCFESHLKRQENCTRLIEVLDDVFARKPQAQWLAELGAEDLICGPVNTYADLAQDPQVIANDYIVDLVHPVAGRVKVPGIPVQLGKTPGRVRGAAPELGQHTEEVLLNIVGCTWEEIQGLREREVI